MNIADLTPEAVSGWGAEAIPLDKRGGLYFNLSAGGKPIRMCIEGASMACEPHLSTSPAVTVFRIEAKHSLKRAAAVLSEALPPVLVGCHPGVDALALEEGVQLSRLYRGRAVSQMRFPFYYDRIKGLALDQRYSLEVELVGVHLGSNVKSLEWRLLMLRITDPPVEGAGSPGSDSDAEIDPEDRADVMARVWAEIEDAAKEADARQGELAAAMEEARARSNRARESLKSLSADRRLENYLAVHEAWMSDR
jgi:hypothetical protein